MRFGQVVTWATQRLGEGSSDVDVSALTLSLVESMSAYLGMCTTFGRVPG
jgi:hypothetical protein